MELPSQGQVLMRVAVRSDWGLKDGGHWREEAPAESQGRELSGEQHCHQVEPKWLGTVQTFI